MGVKSLIPSEITVLAPCPDADAGLDTLVAAVSRDFQFVIDHNLFKVFICMDFLFCFQVVSLFEFYTSPLLVYLVQKWLFLLQKF
jgi:hypothetical protein